VVIRTSRPPPLRPPRLAFRLKAESNYGRFREALAREIRYGFDLHPVLSGVPSLRQRSAPPFRVCGQRGRDFVTDIVKVLLPRKFIVDLTGWSLRLGEFIVLETFSSTVPPSQGHCGVCDARLSGWYGRRLRAGVTNVFSRSTSPCFPYPGTRFAHGSLPAHT